MIRLPFGLCDITYGDMQMSTLADAVTFEAVPIYTKLYGGQGEKFFMFGDYEVSLNVYLAEESLQNLTLAIPHLQPYANGGFYDNPLKVDRTGKPLIIHPRIHGEDREFDLVIMRAIVDPENPFQKVYGKDADKYHVRFIGLPSKQLDDESKYKSYFYFGDWQASGVLS